MGQQNTFVSVDFAKILHEKIERAKKRERQRIAFCLKIATINFDDIAHSMTEKSYDMTIAKAFRSLICNAMNLTVVEERKIHDPF